MVICENEYISFNLHWHRRADKATQSNFLLTSKNITITFFVLIFRSKSQRNFQNEFIFRYLLQLESKRKARIDENDNTDENDNNNVDESDSNNIEEDDNNNIDEDSNNNTDEDDNNNNNTEEDNNNITDEDDTNITDEDDNNNTDEGDNNTDEDDENTEEIDESEEDAEINFSYDAYYRYDVVRTFSFKAI